MRGEYFLSDSVELIASGLPPHAWGILSRVSINVVMLWITPTCVGNTNYCLSSGKLAKDYPHMRGEYTKQSLI